MEKDSSTKKEKVKRITITNEAKKLIDKLRKEHGELMFHQSGGCCDGSQPMCFQKGEFMLGPNDILIGEIHGCNFYISESQFQYWKNTQLCIDITKGRGSSFSLDIPTGYRFITKSRVFTNNELKNLSPVSIATE